MKKGVELLVGAYFALVVILCFTGRVKSLYQPNASEVL